MFIAYYFVSPCSGVCIRVCVLLQCDIFAAFPCNYKQMHSTRYQSTEHTYCDNKLLRVSMYAAYVMIASILQSGIITINLDALARLRRLALVLQESCKRLVNSVG